MPPKELVDEIKKAYNEYKKEKGKEVDYLTFYNGFVACNRNRQDENSKLLDVINNQDVKIADLDETIANLKEQVQSQVEATIELDKENAELESDFRICEHNADTYYDQLVKATEIIKEFLSYYHSNEYPYQMLEILGKAEQFIKDSEKENNEDKDREHYYDRMWFKTGYLAGAEPREKRIEELEQKLEQTEKDLADYQFNYPTIKELEDHLAEEVELHLHAEEYTKSLEQENNKLLDVINNQDVKIADLESENAELKERYDKVDIIGYDALKNLTKAKEIIKFLINPQLLDKPQYYEWRLKAEQFLQEIEK